MARTGSRNVARTGTRNMARARASDVAKTGTGARVGPNYSYNCDWDWS